MTADHLSYQRATTVSLIGLAIQAVLALVMLVYSRLGNDPAAMTGAIAMLLGLPVWAVLALVFHQHKLERLEAMEAEAYRASSAAEASVFAEAGADQTQQAAKLAGLHKWFLPVAGIIFALTMALLGAYRFILAQVALSELAKSSAPYQPPTQHGWAIAIGVGCAVIGFIFARFVAGMAKQKLWALLHAGSAMAVASALIGAAQVLAHFLFVATRKVELLQYMPTALAIFMMALGAEALLNFVLNLYRPRRPGEYQRPAFDSRVLAFIAAPDRLAASISEAINYQFGFNVSSTWFYRLVSRSIGSLVILGVLVVWALSAFAVVRPNETGLLLVNGRLARQVEPGLVFKYPWPFASVITFPSSAATTLNLASAAPSKDGPILWTTEHSADEKDKLLILQPSSADAQDASRFGELTLIAAEIPVQYRVKDLQKYLGLAQDAPGVQPDKTRQELLTAIASGVMIRQVATRSLDEMLGPERAEIAAGLRTSIQAEFDRIESGVDVLFVGVAGVHPAQSVAPAFESVVQKDQRREAEIEKSRAYAIRTLARVAGDVDRAKAILTELDALETLKANKAAEPERVAQEQKVLDLIIAAGGEAASTISEARAYRWTKHMSDRARVVRSRGQLASYRAAPSYFMISQYVDALRTSLQKSRVYLSPFDAPRVDLNLEESEPNISVLSTQSGGSPTGN